MSQNHSASPPPRFLHILFILAAVLISYGNTLENDFVRWDDPDLILENPTIRQLTWPIAAMLTYVPMRKL